MQMTHVETYHWYKAHGICVRCHHADAIFGRTLCPDCRDSEHERGRRRRERENAENREAYLEKQREANRKRYAERKQAGICIACWRKVVSGHTRCLVHLAKDRARERATRGQKDPNECRYCHEPRAEGYAFCEMHLERAREIGRQIGKLPIPSDHPWKRRKEKEHGKAESVEGY